MTTINKVLSNEMRQKLAKVGGLGFTVNKEFLYVPKVYRKKDDNDQYLVPKELWPVFKLEGKDGIESSKMEGSLGHMEFDPKTDVKKWVSKSGQQRIKILQDGVKGWKTFYDASGELIPFRENNGKIHNESLGRIPSAIAADLSNAITERTSLTPEELEGLEF